jgi:hypothetical protein
MNLLKITDETKEKIGITGAHITVNGKDRAVQIRELSDTNAYVTMPEKNIVLEKGNEVEFVINTKYESNKKKSIVVNTERTNDILMCELMFNDYIEGKLKEELSKLEKLQRYEGRRKEERIMCTEENIKKLGLRQKVSLVFRNRDIPGYIKDLSLSAVRIVTDEILLEEDGEEITIKLYFTSPIETIIVTTYVIRKEPIFVETVRLSVVVLGMRECIRYKNRLLSYFTEKK